MPSDTALTKKKKIILRKENDVKELVFHNV